MKHCITKSFRINASVHCVLNSSPASQVYILLYHFTLRSYLDLDISFSGEEADLYMQKAIFMVLFAVDTLKGLFFVKNLFESLKVRPSSLSFLFFFPLMSLHYHSSSTLHQSCFLHRWR